MGWLDAFIKPDPNAPAAPSPGGIDIDAILASSDETPVEVASTPAAPQSPHSGVVEAPSVAVGPVAGSTANLVKDRPFADIYREFMVPSGPKSVDEIMLVLAGIATLPAAAQQQVLTSMDVADKSWEMSDVLADAAAKIQALGLAKQGLQGQLDTTLASSQALVKTADAAIAEINQTVGAEIQNLRDQITAMEEMRTSELATQETARSAALAAQISAKTVSQTEAARYSTEVGKLQTFINTYS